MHPVQEKIHLGHGSQCGFCTPGMVMSLSSELRNLAENDKTNCLLDVEDMEKCLQGNLCRCTGYRPILESFDTFCKGNDEAKINICSAQDADPDIPDEILKGTLNQDFLQFVNSQVSSKNNISSKYFILHYV